MAPSPGEPIIAPRPADITVLMSVYDGERPAYFAGALESLEKQTTPAARIVLVCDGPLTAGLDRVVSEFEARLPLAVVRLPLRCGLANALNQGLSHCKHEWVARFDSDDVCEPDRLERQLEYLARHPEVDVLGSCILEFERHASMPYANRTVPLTHAAIVKAAKYRNPLNHMTVLFRKAHVTRAGGYPGAALNEDYALWVALILAGSRFANLEAPLVRVRAGAGLAQRRGGLAYLATEVALQRSFLARGFIGRSTFVRNVALRVVVRLLPGRVRRWLYRVALREPVDAGLIASARNGVGTA